MLRSSRKMEIYLIIVIFIGAITSVSSQSIQELNSRITVLESKLSMLQTHMDEFHINVSTSVKSFRDKIDRIDAYIGQLKRADGWKQSPEGSWVRYFDVPKIWTDARSHCQSLGPDVDLASVLSLEQHNWLARLSLGDTWIGAHDRHMEGQFKWAFNNQPLTFTRWNAWRLQNLNRVPYCVMISGADEKWWYDIPCSEQARFFCQQL